MQSMNNSWIATIGGVKGPFPTLMQRGRLFLFWIRSIVKWCTLMIGYLFLSACIFVRKFIAHSKLRAVFSLCHIALLNAKNKYWFFVFDPWQGHTPRWLSRTMAYTTVKTVNTLTRKLLHLNHVVSERPKKE